jgi:integrase
MPDTEYERVEDHIWRYTARGQNRFMVRITVDGQPDRRKGLKTLLDARERRDMIIRKHAIPVRPQKAPILKDAAATFLTACEARGLSATTLVNYRNGFEHICECFGTRRCDTITREQLREFLRAKLAGTWPPPGVSSRFSRHKLGYGTVRTHICGPLFQIFQELVDDDRLSKNPMHGMGKSLGRTDEIANVEVDPFTENQVATILEASHPPRLVPAVPGGRKPRIVYVEWMLTNVMVHTGVRSGEAIGLLIEDLDLDRRRMNVSKTFRQTYGLHNTTKGRKARWVDLMPSLAKELRSYVEWLRIEVSAAGRTPKLLFPDITGWVHDSASKRVADNGELYITLSGFSKYFWYPVLKAANVPLKNPHQLRHTYATNLIGKGVGIEYVSHQLGHSSLSVTDKIYNHWKPPVSETRGVDLLERRGLS